MLREPIALHAARDGLADGPTGLTSTLWHLDLPAVWPAHDHADHEFVAVLSGTFTLETDDHRWIVPPTLGVWIPAGIVHRAEGTPGTRFYCMYARPAICPIEWSQTTVVSMTPMLSATIAHIDQAGLAPAPRARAEAVFFDLLHPVQGAPIDLPMPRDERAREVALALIDDPGNTRSLDEWGHHIGASTRTLTRVFVAETGMNFDQWRLQARMRVAVNHLAGGCSVAMTARKVGYRSTSAFVATFRRATGLTPGDYLAERRHQPAPGALLTG